MKLSKEGPSMAVVKGSEGALWEPGKVSFVALFPAVALLAVVKSK